jgi:uncharacterized iron-regulated membrane protein
VKSPAGKMGLRQSMAALHTWSGLVLGWLLFAVFVTGTMSYFRVEISQWARPELQRTTDSDAAASAAVRHLQQIGQGATRWLIDLPGTRDAATHLAIWRDRTAPPLELPRFQRAMLDAATGQPSRARDTHGGDFFYYFHFDLLLPGAIGRIIVGIAAMAMLVSILSGVITHRRIFADFFTFRPGKAQRSWLDAHNLTAVLALPYHLMITYTGLLTLMFVYLPFGLDMAYGSQRAAFQVEASRGIIAPPAANRAASLIDLAPLLVQAREQWRREAVGRINIYRPNDAHARIELIAADDGHVSHHRGRLVFDGVTGALLDTGDDVSWVVATERAMYGLHLGRFGGPVLRGLLFLSGLAGSAMVATGLVLWLVSRRRKGSLHIGHRLVGPLNIAAIAGLPVAIAVFFWANRLLPLDLADRADGEGWCFFLSWALMLLHAVLRPEAKAWCEQVALAAALFALLPLVNGLTTDRHLLASFPAGDWSMAGMDLGLLATGLLCGTVALYLRRRPIDIPRSATI